MNCLNCGAPVAGNYCSSCGQKAQVSRLSLSQLWMDFQSRIYGFDGVFPRTVKDLTVRPGKVVDDFIKGVRIRYVGPAGYFFLILTISILLMELTGFDLFEFSKSTTPIVEVQSDRQTEFARLITDFVYKNMRLVKFGTIPINAFWIWLFTRRKGYNFIESSVPSFYAQGQMEFFFIINIVVLYFFHWHFYQWVFVIEPLYYGFMFATWFGGRQVSQFFKGILVWVLSYLVYILVFTAGAVIWLTQHPEILKSLKR